MPLIRAAQLSPWAPGEQQLIRRCSLCAAAFYVGDGCSKHACGLLRKQTTSVTLRGGVGSVGGAMLQPAAMHAAQYRRRSICIFAP